MSLLDQLSDIELYWLDIIKEDESMLDYLIDKRDRYITDRFINFMKLIIKYGNLKDNSIESGTKVERVIRIHRNVPTKYLDKTGCEYIIFNGLYIVSEVVFYDREKLYNYFKSADKNVISDVPEDSLYYIPRDIIIDNKKMCVFPVRNDIIDRYVTFMSNWSYPTFSKNEGD